MPTTDLPFELVASDEVHNGDPFSCSLFRMLPEAIQETSRESVYLLEYLHSVPLETIGVPDFYPSLDRKLGDLDAKNLIYPVEGGLFTHVIDDPDGGRAYYISIEPRLSAGLDEAELARLMEVKLLGYAMEFDGVDTPEHRIEVLERIIDEQCGTEGNNSNGFRRFVRRYLRRSDSGKLTLGDNDLRIFKYIMTRDKIGLGVLEPLIRDTNIEDISCSGVGSLFIEHKVFDSLRTAFAFASHDELDEFVLRLSDRIKKPVTFRNPIVDAVLPDGSRINIVYGEDVSKRGSNFTIRKFAETPISVIELLGFGSIDHMMAAYLSLVIGEGMNVFVSGETASGKTTLLNALNVFMHPDSKIVSIEDTPELQVPHPNWIREVTRAPKPGEEGSGVGMFDLLKAALRQRPNQILIGEIRGEEGLIAFGAMQTGHACMATFHASSVEKLIQRLTGSPINVPKTYVDNLNVVVIQTAVTLPNGKPGRRAVSVNEIVGYDSAADSFSFVEVFRWDPVKDVFEFVGHMNSYILEHKIAPKLGIPSNKKRQVYSIVSRRARVLEKLAESGVTDFHEFYKVISKAQRQGVF